MAAAPDPLLSSQKRSNSAKLGRLIFQEGTVGLRSLFDSYHKPWKLKDSLRSKIGILRSLRDSNLISPEEWKLLFPDDGSRPTSQNMEAHLLFVLLQNICGLPKPSTGINLAKFNWLISEVASRTTSVGVENEYFNHYWSEITNVFSTLEFEVSFSYEELKDRPVDKNDEDKYHRLLVEWTRKKIENQDVAAHSVQEATETIDSVLQRQDETKSKLMQSTKMPFTWSTSSIIGTGCKGTKVYHGQLTSNGREVAVKKMYNGVFDKGEAEKLRKCIHPNIIRCFATHEEDEFFYLALELGEKTLMVCIGENKFDSSCGDLSVEKCFVEIASGVAYLHENSICHRDIKPENILLMAKNDEYSSHRFVLADFNCARDVPSGETISTNSTVGTRGWMAPEMCGVGSRRTLKVDIFSLGCVYYYTLTKKHPYGGDGETMQLSVCQNNINKKQSPSSFIYRSESYKHFAKLLLRMIHADVDKRPAASEVFEDLQSSYKQKPPIQHMMAGQPNMQHQPQTFRRQQRIQGSDQIFPVARRPISIRPSHPSPQQNPMYQSPPTGTPMMPLDSPQGQPSFRPQQQQYVQRQNEFTTTPVVSGQMQFRPVVPQQVAGQFAPVPSPAFSQQQAPYVKDAMPKKKKKNKYKEFDKKDTSSDLMDAYTERPAKVEPPPVEDKEVHEVKAPSPPIEEETPAEEKSWEDKEDLFAEEPLESEEDGIDEMEPEVTAGKLTYDREFLLKFQYEDVCKEKPEGLPDIEVVLDAARGPQKLFANNRMQGADFAPSWMKQGRQGNQRHNVPSGARKAPQRKVILPEVQEVKLKRSENAWIRPKDKNQGSPDEAKTSNSSEFTLQKSRTSSPAQHTSRIQKQLLELILKRKARNEEVFEWIDKHVKAAETKRPSFIRSLVIAVCEASAIQDGSSSVCKCDQDLLKSRKVLLQKYIDGNSMLELHALYALQSLAVSLDHPPGFLKSFFDSLYDEDIITEDTFYAWEKSNDSAESKGKGPALKSTTEFFRWLRSAAEESGDEN